MNVDNPFRRALMGMASGAKAVPRAMAPAVPTSADDDALAGMKPLASADAPDQKMDTGDTGNLGSVLGQLGAAGGGLARPDVMPTRKMGADDGDGPDAEGAADAMKTKMGMAGAGGGADAGDDPDASAARAANADMQRQVQAAQGGGGSDWYRAASPMPPRGGDTGLGGMLGKIGAAAGGGMGLPNLPPISQAGDANFKGPGGMVPKSDQAFATDPMTALKSAGAAGAGVGGGGVMPRPAPLPVSAPGSAGMLDAIRRALAGAPRGNQPR